MSHDEVRMALTAKCQGRQYAALASSTRIDTRPRPPPTTASAYDGQDPDPEPDTEPDAELGAEH